MTKSCLMDRRACALRWHHRDSARRIARFFAVSRARSAAEKRKILSNDMSFIHIQAP
ncbi:hypothetical protein C7S13_7979 [Burkholderia cepacia]|nr:hypothetical protein [Burkholderia cepacia]